VCGAGLGERQRRDACADVALDAVVVAIALAMIVLERVRPGRRWPTVPTWWARALLINGIQIALVFVAGATCERWLRGPHLFALAAHGHGAQIALVASHAHAEAPASPRLAASPRRSPASSAAPRMQRGAADPRVERRAVPELGERARQPRQWVLARQRARTRSGGYQRALAIDPNNTHAKLMIELLR
jgi:hypothetical protein